MDDAGTLLAVLTQAIGLIQARQRQAIVTLGFDTCKGLRDTWLEDLRGLFSTIDRNNRGLVANQQVRFNLTVKSRMYALREEFIMRNECNLEIGLNMLMLLDIQVVNTFIAKPKAWKIAKDAASTSLLPAIEVPKLMKKKWKEFRRALLKTFGRQRGVNSVLLTYVIHANVVNDYEDAYESTEKQLVACLRYAEENYNTDKEVVYSIFVEHSKESEMESIVNQFSNTRNGRLAWVAIVNHMQSPSYMDSLKTAATSRIKNAHYQGEKRDFGITCYYTIHSSAHNDLETAGEPMSKGMKITNFWYGLKDTIAVNYAITTKREPAVLLSFNDFYNSFSAKLLSHLTLINASSSSSSRTINSVQHGGWEGEAQAEVGDEAVEGIIPTMDVAKAGDLEEEGEGEEGQEEKISAPTLHPGTLKHAITQTRNGIL